jgi:hypothetical protein
MTQLDAEIELGNLAIGEHVENQGTRIERIPTPWFDGKPVFALYRNGIRQHVAPNRCPYLSLIEAAATWRIFGK